MIFAGSVLETFSTKSAKSRQGFIHFGFAKSFATSRACFLKSRATEPSVRFFRVRIPVGTGAIGSWTGKTLSSGRKAMSARIKSFAVFLDRSARYGELRGRTALSAASHCERGRHTHSQSPRRGRVVFPRRQT